jgi:hypothetical protein
MIEPRGWKIGRGVRQECFLSLILFNFYSESLTTEALEEFEELKIRGKSLTL